LLDGGYRGAYYEKIDGLLKKSPLLTLDMLSPNGEIGFALPAFEFDGERYTQISHDASSLSVRYLGYECAYVTDAKIVDLGNPVFNRNGRYRAFIAAGCDSMRIKIKISEIKNG
jgi:hypothetical protein